jgi:glycosyltransferase involved in cell wall biosynthesis
VRHVHRSYDNAVGRWIYLPHWIRRRADADALDVIVSALSHSNLVALLGLKLILPSRVPVVISEHNLPSVLLRIDRRAARTKLWLMRRIYRFADAAVAVSHAVAAELVSRYAVPQDRVAVVPNPVLKMREAHSPGLPASIHLAFVGRLVPQKAPHLLVQTLARLADMGIAVRGTLVGDGPLRAAIAADARRARVQLDFAGWRTRWQDEVRGCDCLLLPSEVEGFGNVLVEAAAAGMPCVARSSALGVADAIVPGVTGELVAAGTPEALAAGVIRAISRPKQDPIEAWLRRFTPESSGNVLLDVVWRVTAQSDLNTGRDMPFRSDQAMRAA